MNALDHPDRDQDPEASNDHSSTSYFEAFIHRKDTKKSTTNVTIVPLAAKIQNLSNQLITGLEITTPSRLRAFQLRKQLKNYQFERHEKRSESENLSMFGMREEEIIRDQNNLIITLASVMKEFRTGKDRKFHFMTKKNNRVFSFYHEEKVGRIQSIMSMSGFGEPLAPELQKEGIPFEKEPHQEYERVVIRNQAISIFWGRILNKTLQSDRHYRSFQIIANFSFCNGFESLPIETFNGSTSKKELQQIANEKFNILGQPYYETFVMKIEGLWTVQNLRELDIYLTQSFGEAKFDVSMQFHQCTKAER